MEDRRAALLRELERADEAIAAELAEVDELYVACETARGRALELEAFLGRLPDERAQAAREVEETRRAAASARAAAEKAAEEVAAAKLERNSERQAAARRFEVRARDALRIGARRAEEAGERAAALEAEARTAAREAEGLDARARELATALRERSRVAVEAGEKPTPGPAGVAEWGTRARAALLVARSQLVTERDAVVRQANELGASVLGEALPATSAAGVARRVERELGRS